MPGGGIWKTMQAEREDRRVLLPSAGPRNNLIDYPSNPIEPSSVKVS
jgi:hypothetical protein